MVLHQTHVRTFLMANGTFSAVQNLRLIRQLASDLNYILAPEAVDQLARYVELVAEWNRKIDLTAAKESRELVEVLLADAMILSDEAIVPRDARVLDIGSGAGAPAIPLLIMRDDLWMCLVEPKKKRIAFLNTVIGSFELTPKALVLPIRIPARITNESEVDALAGQGFDVAMSRAVFPPEVWMAIGSKLARRTLLLTAQAKPPEPPCGITRIQTLDYELPSNNAPRRITVLCRDICEPASDEMLTTTRKH
jgi:16S rRNA (guanine527-N7)-methyltransferase